MSKPTHQGIQDQGANQEEGDSSEEEVLEEELDQAQDEASPKDQPPGAITRARARQLHQQLKDGLMIQGAPNHGKEALITCLHQGELGCADKRSIEPII